MSNKLCRICLETKNLCYIFKDDEENIASKIMALSSVELISGDGLPEHVCNECINKIDKFLEFKNQIESTNQYLLSASWADSENEKTENSDKISIDENYLVEQDCIQEDLEDDNSTDQKISEINNTDEKNIPDDGTKVLTKRKKMSGNKIKEPIQCNICGKLLSTKFRLKCHMRTHTGEKPYKCNSCEKSFALSYNLKIHERIHTGEKPLECQVCAKKFTQTTGLISHLRLHTGENPYRCHLCPKGFKTASHLKYHIRLHTGEKNYGCQTCKKAFITRSDLSRHLKIHTGERSHVCTICGMRLTRAYHLERHMITHTGEKRFKCDTCGQSYAQNYDLKRHMKIHTEKYKLKGVNRKSGKDNCPEDIILLEFLVSNGDVEKKESEAVGKC